MLIPFTGPALSLLLQSQLFAELHQLPPLCLKNLSQHETVPSTSPGEGLASPPSAPWASMTINFLFLGRVRTSSGKRWARRRLHSPFLGWKRWEWAKLSPCGSKTGPCCASRLYRHTRARWASGVAVGIRSHGCRRGGQLRWWGPTTALLLSSVAEGQRVCSTKQGMPKAWTHPGFYTHRALAEGLLASTAHQGYSYRSFSCLTSSERNPLKAVQGWLVSRSHTQ